MEINWNSYFSAMLSCFPGEGLRRPKPIYFSYIVLLFRGRRPETYSVAGQRDCNPRVFLDHFGLSHAMGPSVAKTLAIYRIEQQEKNL